MKYKKYRLGKLFDVDSWVYGKNKDWKTRFDNPIKGALPVISGITINNGVNYYTKDIPLDDEVFEDSLTISTRGEYSGTVTYHEGKFVLANNILVMLMPGLSLKSKLYVATAISKLGYGGYSNYPRKETLKNDEISLPVKTTYQIDFTPILSGGGTSMINIDTSNWKTYKLDELFEKIEVNTLPYKANDLPTNPDDIYNLPALTAGVDNQGLSRFVPREGATILKNCISVSANGANTGIMFYQPNEFTVLQDSYALKWKRKEQIGEKEYLFLISVMQRVIKGNYNWSNKAGWNKIRNIEIKLPVIEIEEIDFDFMDSLISELEEERISELDAYLKVSDLDNYKLSKDEELTLQNFSSKQFKEFSIVKDVFYVNNTHNILSSDIKPNSGTTPYVTAGEKNNSVSTYIKYDENQIEKGNGIMIGGKTLVVTYQKDPYFSNDSHNLALYLKNITEPTEDEMLFLVSSLYKSLKHKYSWGDSISRKKIQTDTLSLPVDENGEIDFEYMKKIIHVIKKLVIKDVVDWKDKIINKTKEIVHKN